MKKAKVMSCKNDVSPLRRACASLNVGEKFLNCLMQDKNVVLIRQNKFGDVTGSVPIGAPFYDLLPEEVVKRVADHDKVKNWVFLPVYFQSECIYHQSALFAGLNIVRKLKPEIHVEWTFVECVLAMMSYSLKMSEFVDFILCGVFTPEGSTRLEFKQSCRFRSVQECRLAGPNVERALIDISRGKIDVYREIVADVDVSTPVLIYTSEKHRLIECLHSQLRKEILSIVAVVEDGLFERKNGAVIVPMLHRTMSLVPEGRGAISLRMKRLVLLAENTEALSESLEIVGKTDPCDALRSEKDIEPASDIQMAIFEVLWRRTLEETDLESRLICKNRLNDTEFI